MRPSDASPTQPTVRNPSWDMTFHDVIIAHCRHVRQPPSQAAQSYPFGSPSIAHADKLMYQIATIAMTMLQKEQVFWAQQSPEATLYRLAVASPLPKLVRKQVRREIHDANVLGCCYGITRSRAPQRIMVCKSGCPQIQQLIHEIIASLRAWSP